MERTVVRLDARKAAARVARWQKIADEAARQCGRADLMTVEPIVKLESAVRREVGGRDVRIVLDEEEGSVRLRDVLRRDASGYRFLIGPEGGVTREEVAVATFAGFVGASLGPRTLRTETVAPTLLAIVQHALGDLG